MGQLGSGAELAIGDIEEIRPAMETTQIVPGLDVGGDIVGVARVDPVVNGDRPVRGNAQTEDQLFQIRSMIFALSTVQLQPRACAPGNAPTGLDGGAVVLNPLTGDIEGANNGEHQPRL